MKVQIPSAQVLEVSEREYQGKTYHDLILYEFGQKGFRRLIQASVHGDNLSEAKSLVGKATPVSLNMYQRGDKVSFAFAGAGK